jgi:hypothetical protein
MRLAAEIAEAIGIAAQRWAESTSDAPLVIRKTPDGAVCAQALPRSRYTAVEFAAELCMSPNTWRKNVKEHFCLEPDSAGGYSHETVEDVKRWLRNEEKVQRPSKVRW